MLADRLFKGRRPNFDFSFYWSNPNCDLQQQVFFLAKYTHGDKFQLNIYIGIEYILPKIYDIWRVSNSGVNLYKKSCRAITINKRQPRLIN